MELCLQVFVSVCRTAMQEPICMRPAYRIATHLHKLTTVQ